MSVPPIAITIGDGAGVGPELILRTADQLRRVAPFVVYGSAPLLESARRSLVGSAVTVSTAPIRSVSHPSSRDRDDDTIHVVEVLPPDSVPVDARGLDTGYPWGQALAPFGTLQYRSLERAIDDAVQGEVAAICTAPWNKKRNADAGLPPTGHTEVLAERSGTSDVVMVLAGDVLRVALATAHVPLADVTKTLTVDRIVRTVEIFEDGLKRWYGFTAPQIALCGVNPHAGEGGVLGAEDADVVAPAVEVLHSRGMDVTGPWPADTLFPRVANGAMRADGIVAMYHDQGLGPLKTFHFGNAANITFGLPFVRTSVDHGTAYDIAGRGVASVSSFVYAYELAARMVRSAS